MRRAPAVSRRRVSRATPSKHDYGTPPRAPCQPERAAGRRGRKKACCREAGRDLERPGALTREFLITAPSVLSDGSVLSICRVFRDKITGAPRIARPARKGRSDRSGPFLVRDTVGRAAGPPQGELRPSRRPVVLFGVSTCRRGAYRRRAWPAFRPSLWAFRRP